MKITKGAYVYSETIPLAIVVRMGGGRVKLALIGKEGKILGYRYRSMGDLQRDFRILPQS